MLDAGSTGHAHTLGPEIVTTLPQRSRLGLLAGIALLAACQSLAPSGEQHATAPCDLHYRITPRYDLQPRAIEVELTYAAGERSESFLRATPGWAGVTDYARFYGDWAAIGAPHQQVVPTDLPNRWRVMHRPGETVTVRWRVRTALEPTQEDRPQPQATSYRTQVGDGWFQFFGYGALPSVEHWSDDQRAHSCITLREPQAAAPVFGSFGVGRDGQAHWRMEGSPAIARHAFYAGGGAWRLAPQTLASGTVVAAVRGRFDALADADFAQATRKLIDAQRRFWGNEAAPMQFGVLTPNHVDTGNSGGTLVHQTAVLHAPNDFRVGGGVFEFLVAHENLHQWFPRRFGGTGEGGVSQVPHYWFSEGFTDYYTHRLLMASGLWTPEQYAERLTEKIRQYLRSPARTMSAAQIAPKFFDDRDAGQQLYARGEFLALKWDHALRARGHAGLDTVLRGLMLPATTPAGQTGAPLASERVLNALQPLLAPAGIDPRADVVRHVVEGQPFDFSPRGATALLGNCLAQVEETLPIWALGFDRASLGEGQLRGVDPDGPAYAAGLRDGMHIVGRSIYGGDVTKDALVQVREPGGDSVRNFSYRPVSSRTEVLPRWQPLRGAGESADCMRWRAARP